MKNWKCTVCGYLHAGNKPLSQCPVCKADQRKFIPVQEGEKAEQKGSYTEVGSDQVQPIDIPFLGTRFRGIFALLIRRHMHPISSHVPNGVLPMSVLFIVLAAIFGWQGVSQAVLYNMVFVLLALPFVLFSGYLEWKFKYGGHWTWLFRVKISCALATFALALLLTVWLALNPDLLTVSGEGRAVFVLLGLAILAAAGTAGYLGGKLVFKD
ncbi:MAG: rubredoxin-like domain-containing protein [Desulfohalobiaceae bacterium]